MQKISHILTIFQFLVVLDLITSNSQLKNYKIFLKSNYSLINRFNFIFFILFKYRISLRYYPELKVYFQSHSAKHISIHTYFLRCRPEFARHAIRKCSCQMQGYGVGAEIKYSARSKRTLIFALQVSLDLMGTLPKFHDHAPNHGLPDNGSRTPAGQPCS